MRSLFESALAATRAGNLFTTHTAVAAGFDRFTPALIEQYLGWLCHAEARHHPPYFWPWAARIRTTQRKSFQHGLLAIRGSGSVNGVRSLARESQPASF